MVSGKQGVQPRFGPSDRILELAKHKTSRAVWATTPCERVSLRPVSVRALRDVPSPRIRQPDGHKRDFSAREEQRRKEEAAAAASFFRKSWRPSSKTSQYESSVRLSAPRRRRRSFEEDGPPLRPPLRPPHSSLCDLRCPVWHFDSSLKPCALSPRLLQLAQPKLPHPDYHSSRQSVSSTVSFSSRTSEISTRLAQLSLPRLKEDKTCSDLRRPEQPIWTVSSAARKATASIRVEMLAVPKQLSRDYVPPREPEWRKNNNNNNNNTTLSSSGTSSNSN